MHSPAVQFSNITFHYGIGMETSTEPNVLDNVSFHVNAGEFISIIGPSGSGKSTLFKLITGLEQPTSGEILLNGQHDHNRLGRVGYMPQQDLLMPWRTILKNAALPLELKGVAKNNAHQRVLELLEEFGLKGVEHKYPRDLSGGMKQRVSFLRAVLSGSNILLLDEPFSALDAITRMNMQAWLLEKWEKWKTTILFITHDVEEALFLSDSVFVLSETPVQHLEKINVPLGRPRDFHMIHQPEIIKLKEQLIEQLRWRVTP